MDVFGAVSPAPKAGGQKLFTTDKARRALPLVRRIVKDIVASVELLAGVEEEFADARYESSAESLEALADRRQRVQDRLRELVDELSELGVLLKDSRCGLVDFPARYQNRVVYLCWRLGEENITHWHEVDAGFTGRQPIGPDFE